MQWPSKVAKKDLLMLDLVSYIHHLIGSCISSPFHTAYQQAVNEREGAMFNVTGSSLSLKTLREAVHNQKVTKSYGHFH